MVEVGRHVTAVNITDIEKRKFPTKHYVYIIDVVWSDGKQQIICRRYSHFFALQTSLIDEFPKESGVLNPTERILPFLPGKILFGRSHTREVALKRKKLINEYLVKLVKLPDEIAQSTLVIGFLEANEDDVKGLLGESGKKVRVAKTAESISDPVLLEQYIVIANFKKTERNQVSLAAGDTVEVIEKNENGWWFVNLEDEQGWVPSSYLEPIDGKLTETAKPEILHPGKEEKYICKKAFNSTSPDEISIGIGDIVEILEKYPDGWWKIRLQLLSGQTVGFVPVAHLKKVPQSTESKLMKSAASSPKARGFVPPPRQGTIKRKINSKVQQSEEALGNVSGKSPPPPKPEQKEEDEVIYVALTDFKDELNKGNLHITEGAEIVILEKDPNGWWYVRVDDEVGWIPSTVAQRTRRPKDMKKQLQKENPTKEFYTAIGEYKSTVETEISFTIGQQFEVIEKDPCGWWFVRSNGNSGWAPSTYLEKSSPIQKNKRIISNVKDVLQTLPIMQSNNQATNSRSPVPPKRPGTKSSEKKNTPNPEISIKPEVARKPKKTVNSVSPDRTQRGDLAINPTSPAPGSLNSKSPLIRPKQPRQPSVESRPTLPKPPPITGNTYVALGDYQDNDDGMLSLKKGQRVVVLEKDDGGWWLGKSDTATGWVPSNFLQKL